MHPNHNPDTSAKPIAAVESVQSAAAGFQTDVVGFLMMCNVLDRKILVHSETLGTRKHLHDPLSMTITDKCTTNFTIITCGQRDMCSKHSRYPFQDDGSCRFRWDTKYDIRG